LSPGRPGAQALVTTPKLEWRRQGPRAVALAPDVLNPMTMTIVKTRHAAAFALSALVLHVSCATAFEEPSWGLGDKADHLCEPAQELCWNARDTAAMREVLEQQDLVAIGIDSQRAIHAALGAAFTLTHKMTPDEQYELEDLAAQADLLGPRDDDARLELVARMNAGPLERVIGLYYAAFMIPTGLTLAHENSDAFEDGKLDDLPVADPDTIPGATEGMQESLDMLRQSGPLGELLIGMFRISGVLEHDYRVMNAIQFGEYDHETGEIVPSGLSREAKVEDIISRYTRAAAKVGAGAGLVGSIPVAGQFVAIPGELFHIWRLHARMAFQIAAVYGWDLRRDRELYEISSMLLVKGSLKEAGQTFVSFMVVPAVLKAIAPRFGGFQISQAVLRKVAFRPLQLLIDNLLRRKGREYLIHAATSKSVRSLAGQLLPIVGAAINMSIGATTNWLLTRKMGDHIHTLARRWLIDLMHEGTTYLSDRTARDCAFRGLAAIAAADGEIDDREIGLFIAFLAKPYALDDRRSFTLGSKERIEQSRMLASWNDQEDPLDCLRDAFEDSKPQHRVALLTHFYSMMVVDLDESAAERRLYRSFVTELEGGGFFGRDRIDEAQLEYAERAIFATLNPTVDVDDDDDLRELVESITPEDTLEFLANPDPDALRDFECGFFSICSGGS
jgi:hypothetical protein